MIRDPSDGTVRDSAAPEELFPADALKPIVDSAFSGLPTDKIDAKRLKQLEDSRDWLKAYFHRKTEGE